MKIRVEDLHEITSEPIKLFYEGIKSHETREKYTRTLRRILCDFLEDVLHGSFEERRSEEHTSELQSHSEISYAVFCLKKKKK